MNNYAWIITKDLICEGDDVGVIGPCNTKKEKDFIIKNGRKFEMFDDDDEKYYEGYIVGGDGFEPLDDFGTPNAGCTYIKYSGVVL